jgi:hypothetical protein
MTKLISAQRHRGTEQSEASLVSASPTTTSRSIIQTAYPEARPLSDIDLIYIHT